jgi:putative hemolysin
MSAGLAAWAVHPVTLGLAALALVLLFLVLEVLLRSLASIGNVRFQGVLDDHDGLLPLSAASALHLAQLLDALRWLQVGSAGLLWLVMQFIPGLTPLRALVLALALTGALLIASRLLIAPLAEDGVAVLLKLVRPLAWPLLVLAARSRPVPPPAAAEDEEEEASDREIQAYLEAGEAAGIFEGGESELLQSLVDFFDTVVREVMTPRTEMVAVPDTITFDELLDVFASSRKSRIPVYHETIDRVIGVVLVKNLVEAQHSGVRPPVTELVHDCLVVPEVKPLGELLRDFQQNHQQLAIVVDEYGGTSGLVTLEDVVEEIVGDIRDEHEPRATPEWQEVSPGCFRLQGRASLEVLEELFGVELDAEDVDTVGGLVFSLHGTVPEVGTEVLDPARGLRFVVEAMQDRRVVSVAVRRESSNATTQVDPGAVP